MKKIIIISLFFPLSLLAQWKAFPPTEGNFEWSKTGEVTVTDSLRFIQGANTTLTQSGNTLQIAASGGTTTFDGLTDVDLTSAATGNIVMRRSNGVWVDTSAVLTSAGGWIDGATSITQIDVADEVVIGAATVGDNAKLEIKGNANQIELEITGNSTQTADYILAQTNAGTDVFRVTGTPTGQITIGANVSSGNISARPLNVEGAASNNSVVYLAKFVNDSQASPSNGFGSGIIFAGRDDGLNFIEASTQEAIMTDVTNGSEDTDFLVKLVQAGAALSEKFRIKGTGNIIVQQGAGFGTSTLINSTDITVKGRAFFVTDEGIPAASDSSLEIDIEGTSAVIRGRAGDGSASDIAWQNGDSLNFSFASGGYRFKGGNIVLTDSLIVNNNLSAGTNSFSGTATSDTVTVAGAGTGDLYWIQITGAGAPLSTDVCRVEALSGSFVVHRLVAGTSGLTYNWKRERP